MNVFELLIFLAGFACGVIVPFIFAAVIVGRRADDDRRGPRR